MVEEKVLLTKEGYEKLQSEKDYLINQKRAEVSEKIRIARGFGDLSENAEYDEAKDEQAKVELRIIEIENQLKNAVIIERDVKDKKAGKLVYIGDTVKILDIKRDKEMTFSIVGTVEADITQNKISNESPVGKALIGHKENQIVEVATKAGSIQYKILKIIR
ncbi:transcription elongation factor GreA [Peptoniphilaceae bacterium SGI.131]